MIKIETNLLPSVMDWQSTIQGMRNPMNSWDKSDTASMKVGYLRLGVKDKELMIRLIQAGTEHRKFLRMLHIGMVVTAPLYWWREFDAYKIGIVRNSSSTMHKIMSKEFTRDDFSMDGLSPNELDGVIAKLNSLRSLYINCDDEKRKKEYWRKVIMILPNCYNQRANILFNYENAMNMHFQRRYHKLSEWREFDRVLLEQVPYFKDFVECLEEE